MLDTKDAIRLLDSLNVRLQASGFAFDSWAVQTAISVLRRQEPKSVARWNTKEASPYCPNIEECGKPLEEGWAYCPYCGQVVKWE